VTVCIVDSLQHWGRLPSICPALLCLYLPCKPASRPDGRSAACRYTLLVAPPSPLPLSSSLSCTYVKNEEREEERKRKRARVKRARTSG